MTDLVKRPGLRVEPALEPEDVEPEDVERYRTRPARPLGQLLVRVGLWAAVGLGCLGGIVGLVRPPADKTEPPIATPAEDEAVPAPVAGIAELAVQAWLTATPDDRARVDALFVEPPDLTTRDEDAGELVVGQATTIAARNVGEGYWVVAVVVDVVETIGGTPAGGEAASPTGDGTAAEESGQVQTTWYVQVGIVGDPGGSLAALTTPGVVPVSPSPPGGWDLALGEPQEPDPDDPLRTAAEAFLRAVLTGQGDVGRYVAPGVVIAAADPPPFTDLTVDRLSTASQGDDESLRVLVEATAVTSGDVELPVSYELVAVPRVDRWEFLELSGVPSADRQRGSDAS